MTVSQTDLQQAAEAIRAGDLVVYPTETVYGLAADALDPDAVEAVYAAKDRPHDKPLSFAFPDADAAVEYVGVSGVERTFMDEFLPGPVTVVCEKDPEVPEVLTGGRDRVGVRIPDHEVALALLDHVAPITATSANVSGRPSVTDPADLDEGLLAEVAAVVSAGETPGTESTVVDVANREILRAGANVESVRAWLQERA